LIALAKIKYRHVFNGLKETLARLGRRPEVSACGPLESFSPPITDR
jgi:hypothetical protein